jgi:hypothetical protein
VVGEVLIKNDETNTKVRRTSGCLSKNVMHDRKQEKEEGEDEET